MTTETDEWPAKSRYEYDPSNRIPSVVWGTLGIMASFNLYIAMLAAGQFPTWAILMTISSLLYIRYEDLIIAAVPWILVQLAAIVFHLLVELGVVA